MKETERTNAPGTCLFCGRPVRLTKWERARGASQDSAGPMGDGKFCTLRCASLFGACVAALGVRLARGKVTR